MTPPKSLLVAAFGLLFASNTGNAAMCARLKNISAGENHTLALAEDNALWACGDNGSKQSGLGSSEPYTYFLKPVKGENGVGFLRNVATFDAGWYHSLAAGINGTLWAWGTDNAGQLGNGADQNNWDVPRKVHGINNIGYLSDTKNIVYVSAGRSGKHSLAVDSDGYVYAWGYNNFGQCGDGTTNQKDTPIRVLDDDPQTTGVYLGDIAHIVQVDAGMGHSIALDSNGHVWHWGSDSTTGAYPEKVKTSAEFGGLELSNIIEIASCGHSVAADSNGNVWEWISSDSAYKIQGGEMGTSWLEDIVEVSAGLGKSMAITSDGYVLIWGTGGSPEYVSSGEMQTQSGLLENIISINVGYENFKLAICEDGYGWSWGSDNEYGQLGVGDNIERLEPTKMLCAEISDSIYLTKDSQIQGGSDCAGLFTGDNYLVYNMCYGNPVTNPSDPNYYGSIYGVSIIDYLPVGVNFDSASAGGTYDAETHTVTWIIDELAPGDSGCMTITTHVNNQSQPGGQISNLAEMASDMYHAYAIDTVTVCSWGGAIIYVDGDAEGLNNGTSWDDALTDFNDALEQATFYVRDLGSCEIWVAAGTYYPPLNLADYTLSTFQMPEGNVAVLGHFGGIGVYETSPNQRDFNNPAYETIFDGRVVSEWERANYTVTCDNTGEGLLLDGFTFTGAGDAGLYINNYSYPSIIRCKFNGNDYRGIYADYFSEPDIADCLFLENDTYGIYSEDSAWPYVKNCVFDGNNLNSYGLYGSYSEMLVEDCVIKRQSSYGMNFLNSCLTVTGCTIENNKGSGIYCLNSNLEVTNCKVQGNSNNGIEFRDASVPTITNNIICRNKGNGIYIDHCEHITVKNNWFYQNGDSSHESGLFFRNSISPPLVRNNTIIENSPYGIYIQLGRDPCFVNNIIWENGSEPSKNVFSERGIEEIEASYNCIEGGFPGTGNISCDPCFRNPDVNDFHLKDDSNCIDSGDLLADYAVENDIDGRPRVIYGIVDIGADEWANPPDYNWDGFINFFDFAVFAEHWLTDNPEISLDSDTDVDIDDLKRFTECWLWTAYKNKADYNRDDTIDFRDFVVLADAWGTENASVSLDKDSDVDANDLAIFCQNWLWEFNWD